MSITGAAAVAALESAMLAGTVEPTMAAAWKAKFMELHSAVLQSGNREREAEARRRELEGALADARASADKAAARRDDMKALYETVDVEKQQAMVAVTRVEGRDVALQADLTELRTRESELSTEVEQLRADNRSLVEPVLAALTADIADARREISEVLSATEGSATAKGQLRARMEHMRRGLEAHRAQVLSLKAELARARAEPGRIEKQAESVVRVLEAAQAEVARLRNSLAARTAELEQQAQASGEVSDLRTGLAGKAATSMREVEAREAEVAALERSLRAERAAQRDLLERKVALGGEEERARAGSKAAATALEASQGSYDRARRELRRKLDGVKTALERVPLERERLKAAEGRRSGQEAAAAKLGADLASVRREMDVLVASYLREEGAEKGARDRLAEAAASCAALEEEKAAWAAEEALAIKQIGALKAQRDVKAREVARMQAARKTALEQSRMRELILSDLQRRVAEQMSKLKQCASLFDVAKAERNGFASALQTATAAHAELRERASILRSEADVLGAEAEAKERALERERQNHAAVAAARDHLRADVNRALGAYRERQEAVEAGTTALDRLGAVINGLERRMMTLRREHEAAVELRNHTGIQLIDRNDELCVLYEKSNVQDATLAKGEAALAEVTEQCRALRLATAELERRLTSARARLPETARWASRIVTLHQEFAAVRASVEELSAELERPSGVPGRAVALGGSDPSAEALEKRVAQLEELVSRARGEVLEGDVALAEAREEVERLKAETDAGTEGATLAAAGVAAARSVTELQGRVKEANRRLTAVVAELSMHQAMAGKLEAEAGQAAADLRRAQEADDAGLPPSTAAEMRLNATLRKMIAPVEVPSTPKPGPDPRPNAYIPEPLGLPKPFLGPFLPFSPAGASTAAVRMARGMGLSSAVRASETGGGT